MTPSGNKYTGSSNESNPDPQPKAQAILQPGTAPDVVEASLPGAEKLTREIDHFSRLSSEIAALLASFPKEIRAAVEQFARIREQVELKKKELKDLLGMEVSAAAMERLAADHRQQREALERLMADQREQWESEKTRRAREEKDYAENLRIRREREEAEYRQRWAGEKLKAQQRLEEEMRAIQQERLQKLQAVERDCLERELALKAKELEWVQLIQELEQFMSKLTRRTQATTAKFGPTSADQPDRNDPGSADITSLKEMLVSQGQRIENFK